MPRKKLTEEEKQQQKLGWEYEDIRKRLSHIPEPAYRFNVGDSVRIGCLRDVVIKEVCEKYDVPVIDLFTLSGMDPSLSEVRTQYMPDGLHPNAAGHEKIAAIISQSLGNILLAKNL